MLRWMTDYFVTKGIDNPRLDAERLLAHTLKLDRVGLYLNYDRPLIAAELDTIRPLVKRRGQHEPLQYLLGVTEFWSLEFKVSPAVLIPRADTEILVEEALKRMATTTGDLLDVGTGSGAVVISLARECPEWHLTGLDISAAALAVAYENVNTNRVEKTVELIQGDLSALPQQSYDLIVSNPPYIAAEEWDELMPEVRDYEPPLALLAADDGLICYRQLTQQAPSRLKPNGWLLVEIGYQQAEAVMALFVAVGLTDLFIREDYSGHPRVIGGRSSKI